MPVLYAKESRREGRRETGGGEKSGGGTPSGVEECGR